LLTSRIRRAPARRRIGAPLALGTALVSAVAGLGLLPAPSAGATTVAYTGTTSGTQSSITIHRGDQYQRVLNPTGSVTATLDDTNQKIASGKVALNPSFTATFVGPFNLNLYVRTDLEQIGQVTGTAKPSATAPGTTDLVATATTRLHLTVYNQKGATQAPATDPTLTDPVKCAVDLTLTLKGSANRRTGDLALTQDPFTIPTFPNGTPDANKTCGLATNALNTQVAGANNGIALNFKGGPTAAHYTGVTSGTQSTIVIKKGDLIFSKTVHPTGSIVSDIDFVTNKITNTKVTFGALDVPALPGVLAAAPANAHIDLSLVGAPVATISPSGTPGIDNVNVATTARMAVTVSLFSSPGVKLTNPATCYVDLKLNLAGTVDRGTDKLSLGQNPFTIPKFPFFGCGLVGPGLNSLVSGANNTIALNFVDGVVA
jgi:hypothetical protein